MVLNRFLANSKSNFSFISTASCFDTINGYGLLPILEFFFKNSVFDIPYKKVISLIMGFKS